jgi:hypothetical protein
MKAHHVVAGYDWLVNDDYRFHAEAYFQRLFQVPVSSDVNSAYSYINDLQGFANRELVSRGTATNQGIDVSFEKIFKKGSFFIWSASFFRSQFSPLNGKIYSTQYDSKFATNFVGGQEWKIGEKGSFQLGGKLIVNGGQPISPLAAVQRGYSRISTIDDSMPFTLGTKTYIRPDLRLAYRRNNRNSAYIIALDVQNVAGLKNADGTRRKYDPTTQQWVDFVQSGIIPILSFQIDFR